MSKIKWQNNKNALYNVKTTTPIGIASIDMNDSECDNIELIN